MKAKEANLLEFLRGPKQFTIPIYQRTYSWTTKQCLQLWKDILRVANNEETPAHFIGSVVYITDGIYQATGIPQMLVIDGQQRLTTLSLLMNVIVQEKAKTDEAGANRIRNYYVINNDETGEMRYKLILTRNDKDTFINLIENREFSKDVSPRLLENYEFFQNLIQSDDVNVDMIYAGISKLLIVDVSLDRNYDNPQLIFESLNSTGLDLSQADLIRNYILMGLSREQQEYLFTQYWYEMERRFGYADYASMFDRFVRDYLTVKSDIGYIPAIRNVYSVFKNYSKDKDIETLVADISHYSRYFLKLAFPSENTDAEVSSILEGINTLKVDVAYPLLIEIYDDYDNGLLSREDFLEILLLVESYVLRRAICGIPTNSMNKTFATFKRYIYKDDYLNSIKYALLSLTSYRRFPTDNEFWDNFVTRDIYNLRQRRNYILSKLENHGRKEFVNVGNYTVEHIMPQNPNLSKAWQVELGDDWKNVQSAYLHTIGNLTLTGYNPELSDNPFIYKRDIEGGYADSPLRLNSGLGQLEKWNKNTISDRAEELAEIALNLWHFPSLPQEIIEQYRQAEIEADDSYSIKRFEYLEGDIRELYDELERKILNFDPTVRRTILKLYIAFKTTTNFVDIIPQKKRLLLIINLNFKELNDPRELCRDVSGMGRWGNGEVEFGVATFEDLDYAMFLIEQSFNKHTD